MHPETRGFTKSKSALEVYTFIFSVFIFFFSCTYLSRSRLRIGSLFFSKEIKLFLFTPFTRGSGLHGFLVGKTGCEKT
jgi:hypothetical protein